MLRIRRMKTLRTLGFLVTGWCLCLLATTAFAQYSVTRIPNHLGGGMGVFGLNSTGAVAGFTHSTATRHQRGFLYGSGTLTVIDTLGGTQAVANALNDRGQVAGDSDRADGSRHAFLFSEGSVRDLGTLGQDSFALAVNNAGDVAGSFMGVDGWNRVFLYTNGAAQMLDVGSLGGPMTTFAGMNSNGDIAGSTLNVDWFWRAFLYRNGS